MRRLVLMGEGHGDVNALPVLVRRLLRADSRTASIPIYGETIRTKTIFDLVAWNKATNMPTYDRWQKYLQLAAHYANGGAVLAIYDGDVDYFPVASRQSFCIASAAKELVKAGISVGAGRTFSLGFVFAKKEFETWIIAGAESLAGKRYSGDRMVLKKGAEFPESDFENRGKAWLESNGINYRTNRDQAALAEMVDLDVIRAKKLRSFIQLENALSKMVYAMNSGVHICSPA